MIAAWIWYLIAAVVGTVMAFFLTPFSRPAKNWVKKKVRKLGRRTLHESSRAIKARRKQRAATPRGRLKAKRRQQPMRLTYGHRRTADDPTLSRRAARKLKDQTQRAAEKAKLAWLNREEATKDRTARSRPKGPFAVGTKDAPSSEDGIIRCGRPTVNGTPCRNPVREKGAPCGVKHPKAGLRGALR